jgi:hypothetical protein
MHARWWVRGLATPRFAGGADSSHCGRFGVRFNPARTTLGHTGDEDHPSRSEGAGTSASGDAWDLRNPHRPGPRQPWQRGPSSRFRQSSLREARQSLVHLDSSLVEMQRTFKFLSRLNEVGAVSVNLAHWAASSHSIWRTERETGLLRAADSAICVRLSETKQRRASQ